MNTKLKPAIKSLILALPIIIGLFTFIIIHKPSINFLTDKQYNYNIFSDKIDNQGNSVCTLKKNNQELFFKYTLIKGYEFQYAGFSIDPNDTSLHDFRSYNLNIELRTKQRFRLPVRTSIFIDNFTNPSNPNSYLYLIKTLSVNEGVNKFKIDINSINEAPQWWYSLNNISEGELPKYTYKNTSAISIFSDPSYPLNKEFQFTITKLSLTYNYIPFLIWSTLLSLFYYIILWLLWRFTKLKTKSIFVPIEATQIKQNTHNPRAEILEFIGHNYTNPDLKLKDISIHVGLSENQISELLKDFCQLGFKQYLNQIRIEEAKRLLKESDLQISEIAFKVGYNNVTHFNRVFKEAESMSPKGFKEMN